MTPPLRLLRLSQTISPFGVGAIYDVQGESLIGGDTVSWQGRGRRIQLKRLADSLGVLDFRIAPSKATLFGRGTEGTLPFHRFPHWLFCTSCRRMRRRVTADEASGEAPICDCARRPPRLVPMRFVAACRAGHLDDVPWVRWAHSRAEQPNQKQCAVEDLVFETLRGAGGGLRSLVVRCRACDSGRSLDGITSPNALRAIGARCTGGQPWQRTTERVACGEDPRVEQRGSGNLYFPLVSSAIDIPPGSDYDDNVELRERVTNHAMFGATVSGGPAQLRELAIGAIAGDLHADERAVRRIADDELAARTQTPPLPALSPAEGDLLREEWTAFTVPRLGADDRDRFIARTVDPREGLWAGPAATAFVDLIDRVVLADRLREVRALRGFTRLSPPADGIGEVRPDLGRGLQWLPAVEVFGEGIFLSLPEPAVRAWEADPEVTRLSRRLAGRVSASGIRWLPEASARLVMLHTLSHILMRRLSFDCGYSSSSLQERLYVSTDEGEPMAGILIYTAAGDVEGSLGGLVRQGEPTRLLATIVGALQDASWCSQDPVCREVASGRGGLNHAACHACALVSETSCTVGNLLLDRRLVVGDDVIPGFLSPLLEAAWAGSSAS